jgi:anti-sigma regulatory factor (Ser/Thr protein kinase)
VSPVTIVNHREPPSGDAFLHSAVLPDSDDDLVTALTTELRHSAHTCDQVLLVVSDHARALLTEPLRDLECDQQWADPAAFYQRLGFAYEGFRRYLAEQATQGRRVHVVAEPELAGDSASDPRPGRYDAYLAYEAVCNDTYAPYGSPVTCIWDSRRHPARLLDGVRATHRHLLTPSGRQPSPRFQPADAFLTGAHHLPMPPAPQHTDHDRTVTGVAELSGLRATLSAWAHEHRFAAEPADDLLVAVVEVVSNGLRHAVTPVRIRAWHQHDTLIVQCDDAAGLPVPATAGYHRPGATDAAPGGRGLWLVRQLADVVLVDSVPGRTSVRLHFPHAVMHRA